MCMLSQHVVIRSIDILGPKINDLFGHVDRDIPFLVISMHKLGICFNESNWSSVWL